jgi:hypothetical protein
MSFEPRINFLWILEVLISFKLILELENELKIKSAYRAETGDTAQSTWLRGLAKTRTTA